MCIFAGWGLVLRSATDLACHFQVMGAGQPTHWLMSARGSLKKYRTARNIFGKALIAGIVQLVPYLRSIKKDNPQPCHTSGTSEVSKYIKNIFEFIMHKEQ